MEGIRREWERRVRTEEGLQGWRPATVFFGGGTPTALEAGELEELLGWVRSAVDVSGVREWSVEANPGTLTEEKAWVLAQGGVTRV
jgi:oxygen-independent coproporphyrinogen-3 oxidase